MRYYENLFIVNPGYEGDSLQNIIDEYTSFITENGGRVYNVDDWGKRRLAYRIAKQKYGSYVLVEFGADGSIITELEESQRLNDAILSYLTVKLDAEPDLSEARKRPSDDEDEDDDEYDEEHEDVDDDEVDEEVEDEDKEEEETSDIEEDEDEEEEEDEELEESSEDVSEEESGKIRFNGTTWRARSLQGTIRAGEQVRIKYRENITWIVEAIGVQEPSKEQLKNLNRN